MQHVTRRAPQLPDPLPGGDPLPMSLAILQQALLAKKKEERPPTARFVVDVLCALERGEEIDVLGHMRSLTDSGLNPEVWRKETELADSSSDDEEGPTSNVLVSASDSTRAAKTPSEKTTAQDLLGPDGEEPSPDEGSGRRD